MCGGRGVTIRTCGFPLPSPPLGLAGTGAGREAGGLSLCPWGRGEEGRAERRRNKRDF